MNSNGHLQPPKSTSGASTAKSAADVQFTATSPNGVTSTLQAQEHKEKRSTGDKIRKRLSLRPRASLGHTHKDATQEEEVKRAPSTSTRSAHSTGYGSSVNDGNTPERSISSGLATEDSSTARESSLTKTRLSSVQTPEMDRGQSSRSSTNMDGPAPVVVSPELDPAKLVQMALNLSESRRRHASLPVQFPGADHRASTRTDHPLMHSAQSSPLAHVTLANGSRASTSSPRSSSQVEHSGIVTAEEIHFSPATLIRAERARRHFELASQHRRLLDALNAATDNPAIDASAKQYNPLRALRDRRGRDANSTATTIGSDSFQDVDKVSSWVDSVKEATTQPAGRDTDIPPIATSGSALTSSTLGHRRSGTADTTIQKNVHLWSVAPSDLLLDTYLALHHDLPSTAERLAVKVDSKPAPKHHRVHTPRTVSDMDEAENVRKKFLPLKAADRLRGSRLNRLTRSDSASSASSVEAANRALFDPSLDKLNVGPLRKHMEELIQEQEKENTTAQSPVSPDHWGLFQAQQYAARQRAASRAGTSAIGPLISALHTVPAQAQAAKGHSSSEVSRQASPATNSASAQVNDSTGGQQSRTTAVRRLTHLTRGKSKTADSTPESISRLESRSTIPQQDQVTKIDPTRLSVESTRPNMFRRHKTAESTHSLFSDAPSITDKDIESREPASAINRPRIGGRLVDIVRTESSKFGDKVRNRDRKAKGNDSDLSAQVSDVSDVEATLESAKTNTSAGTNGQPRTSLDRTTSRGRFHIPTLPSFKTTTPRDPQLLSPILSNESDDHISRQQAALRLRNRSPRFQRLAPPPLKPSYTRSSSSTQGPTTPVEHEDSSTERLPDTIHEADEKNSRKADDAHVSSASDQPGHEQRAAVQMRDIARVRAVLIASGIKAQTLAQRLESPSTDLTVLPSAIISACKLDTASLKNRPRIEQNSVAIHLLCTYLDDSVRSTHADAKTFQSKQLQSLVTKQEMLKARVKQDLAELVHSTADQADAFNVELSTQATMRTKQIDDAVEDVLRLRRRQFRLLRIALFKLLEWFVLALLWWVWFVVVCFKTAKRAVVIFFKVLQWLFTL